VGTVGAATTTTYFKASSTSCVLQQPSSKPGSMDYYAAVAEVPPATFMSAVTVLK
jgi:hypothetical protein